MTIGAAEICQATQALWAFHRVDDKLGAADAIIGLGSYDLRVADRCAVLYHEALAPCVVFTGASGHWTRDLYDGSEAAAFARRASACGVPAGAILLEETATNIGENILGALELIPDARSVILVTKPQTQLRVRATVDKKRPDLHAMVTAPPTAFEEQPTATQDARGLICEMVGDLERLRLYPRLGYQVAVEIPEPVVAAQQVLIAAGYTDHLP